MPGPGRGPKGPKPKNQKSGKTVCKTDGLCFQTLRRIIYSCYHRHFIKRPLQHTGNDVYADTD